MTNYTITNNDYFKSIEISFTEKPSDDVRNILKALRFRWHYTKKVWYGYANKQVLIDRLNTVLPVKVEKTVKVDPVKVEPVKVEKTVMEKKTEKAVKTVNPFIKPKKEKVKREAGKLKANQESAILTLMKYNYIACRKKIQKNEYARIYVEKDGIAFVGNTYALVKISVDLLTEETKKRLKALVPEDSKITFEGMEKIFNDAVKIQENAEPVYLESMTEKEADGYKMATFSTGLTFNYPLLKDVCRCFDYKVSIKSENFTKPALVEGEGFSAVVCGIRPL